jgi:hypothetical protein
MWEQFHTHLTQRSLGYLTCAPRRFNYRLTAGKLSALRVVDERYAGG